MGPFLADPLALRTPRKRSSHDAGNKEGETGDMDCGEWMGTVSSAVQALLECFGIWPLQKHERLNILSAE